VATSPPPISRDRLKAQHRHFAMAGERRSVTAPKRFELVSDARRAPPQRARLAKRAPEVPILRLLSVPNPDRGADGCCTGRRVRRSALGLEHPASRFFRPYSAAARTGPEEPLDRRGFSPTGHLGWRCTSHGLSNFALSELIRSRSVEYSSREGLADAGRRPPEIQKRLSRKTRLPLRVPWKAHGTPSIER
jgi:hypothetical protein